MVTHQLLSVKDQDLKKQCLIKTKKMMKNYLTKGSGIMIVFVMLFSLQSFAPKANVESAKIAWIDIAYDFGSVEKGIPVSHDFEFSNQGNAPLLISNVKTTCGCTVPSYPKEPIMPGQTEIIKVTYNAAKLGTFNKKITVLSNADEASYSLTISGEVLASN